MGEKSTSGASPLSLTELEAVDGACDRFEAALKAGEAPSIESYIADLEPGTKTNARVHAALFDELLALEVTYAKLSGRRVEASEYLARFPDRASAIERAFRAVAKSAALTPGDDLGNYHVLERIGRGGMGEVFRAHDRALDRDVAIKVLRRPRAADPRVADRDALTRFEREARALAALSHPHILTVFDFGEERGVTFFVTELLEGETLADRLRRGRLSVAEAIAVAIDIATGLAAAHAKGIVHRDLKPGNVFLEQDGDVKVLDFGLALVTPPASAGEPQTSSSTITDRSGTDEPGAVLGSRAYMSPEQAEGRAVDARSDVFAFGAVLFEMLTGERLFGRSTAEATFQAIARAEVPPLASRGVDAGEPLDRLLASCLARDPAARPASAAELVAALRALEKERLGSARPARPRPWLRPAIYGGVVMVALAVAAVASWALSSGPLSLWTHGASSSPAEEDHLLGRHLLDAEDQADISRAIEAFDHAIARDPRHASSYAGLAAAYLALSGTHLPPREALVQAKEAANVALRLDPTLTEARAARAIVRHRLDWDWAGAEAELRRTIADDPRSANALQHLARLLVLSGRAEEGEALLDRAIALEPLRGSLATERASAAYYARRYAEARERFLRILVARPSTFLARWGLGEVELAEHRYDRAIAELEAATKLDPESEVEGELAFTYAASGDEARARTILEALETARADKSRPYVSATAIAVAHLGLGDRDAAFAWLDRAKEDRDEWLLYLRVDPIFQSLADDPRFHALRRAVGIP